MAEAAPGCGPILAESLTNSRATDASQVEPVLDRVEAEVEAFYGDGAYDGWAVRDYLAGEKVHQIIPPRKNAPQS